jgi:hypothetical protein
VGTWHDLDLGGPIAAPLERCAELLGVDLGTVRELAAKVKPYLRADGPRIWSVMQLERQLRPEAYRRAAAVTSIADGSRLPLPRQSGVGADAIRHEVLRPLRPSWRLTSSSLSPCSHGGAMVPSG